MCLPWIWRTVVEPFVLFRLCATITDWGFSLIYFLLFVRVIMSWFVTDMNNQFFIVVYQATEPILRLFRRLPLQIGPIDFSVMVAFFCVYALQVGLVTLFLRLAETYKG